VAGSARALRTMCRPREAGAVAEDPYVNQILPGPTALQGRVYGAGDCLPLTCRGTVRGVSKPKLLRLVDIAEMLAVSKQRVHQLAEEPGFPPPAKIVGRSRLWPKRSIEAWANREWRGSRPWRNKFNR